MATPTPKWTQRKGVVVPPYVPNIFLAAERNDVKALELSLLHYNVNERDEINMTPLHYAASTLADLTIDRLLEHPDIDASLVDDFGRTAATVAFECWRDASNETVDKLNPHCYPWLYPKPEMPSP